jgi:FkbM family methyltransferase
MGLRTWLGLKNRRPPRVPSFMKTVSQAGDAQDLWVLSETNFKRGGFFVEFGAFDGVKWSNTFLLERYLGWAGILAEPIPRFHEIVKRNRKAAFSPKCVWSHSGETLSFRVCPKAVLSTIEGFEESSDHDRSVFEPIRVDTISLNDLLTENGAPRHIDYISVDTEGSELDILSTFDFERFRVDLFSVEHNYSDREPQIDAFLAARGYERVHAEHSNGDGWYRLKNRN